MKHLLRHAIIPYVVMIVVMAGIAYYLFGPLVFHPNDYLFVSNPDGLQIYFNYASHAKSGNGFTLANQSYPFYEYIFMTDSQAMLSVCMSWLNHLGVPIEPYSIGVFNVLLLLGIVLCPLFLFKIFRHLQISVWFSVIFAILITLLSPQWMRICSGHAGLGYLFHLPALLYFILKLSDNKARVWPSLLGLLALLFFFGLNNAHMSLASAMVLVCYGLLFASTKTNGTIWFRFRFLMIAASFLLIYFIILKLGDPFQDREKFPYGFSVFYSQFENIFLPRSGPILDRINAMIKVAASQEEGAAYVGMVGFIMCLFFVLRGLRYLLKGQWHRVFLITLNKPLSLLMLSALPILLYAMALPFRWGLFKLLHYIPMLAQFRAPGRFAWIFYFVLSIQAVYVLFLLYRKYHQRIKFAWLIPMLACMMYLGDAHYQLKYFFRYQPNGCYETNEFKKPSAEMQQVMQAGIHAESFQAMYAIPQINSWSTKWVSGYDQDAVIKPMTLLSYHTGIPWLSAKLSRISTGNMSLSQQMLSDPLIEREIIKLLPNRKPILFIRNKDYVLTENEEQFLQRCSAITQVGSFEYYAFDPSKPNPLLDSVRANFQVTELDKHIRRDFLDPKTYPQSRDTDFVLFQSVLSDDTTVTDYECSIWTQLESSQDGTAWLKFVQNDSTGKTIFEQSKWSSQSQDYQDGWVKVTFSFKINGPYNEVELIALKGSDHYNFRSLLIHPKNKYLAEKMNGKRFINSIRID